MLSIRSVHGVQMSWASRPTREYESWSFRTWMVTRSGGWERQEDGGAMSHPTTSASQSTPEHCIHSKRSREHSDWPSSPHISSTEETCWRKDITVPLLYGRWVDVVKNSEEFFRTCHCCWWRGNVTPWLYLWLFLYFCSLFWAVPLSSSLWLSWRTIWHCAFWFWSWKWDGLCDIMGFVQVSKCTMNAFNHIRLNGKVLALKWYTKQKKQIYHEVQKPVLVMFAWHWHELEWFSFGVLETSGCCPITVHTSLSRLSRINPFEHIIIIIIFFRIQNKSLLNNIVRFSENLNEFQEAYFIKYSTSVFCYFLFLNALLLLIHKILGARTIFGWKILSKSLTTGTSKTTEGLDVSHLQMLFMTQPIISPAV